ncbi:hypothetical protein D7Z54_03850 [Salibacterium salarium]|uniref:Uncharacterized protein n=1 Tax=Salibacterium salarium TaxID=284579 RepID=A0A3R9RGK2_9BACI|nr:hypothetical protein D7Z54_03850 [Salibacterium salarium]
MENHQAPSFVEPRFLEYASFRIRCRRDAFREHGQGLTFAPKAPHFIHSNLFKKTAFSIHAEKTVFYLYYGFWNKVEATLVHPFVDCFATVLLI